MQFGIAIWCALNMFFSLVMLMMCILFVHKVQGFGFESASSWKSGMLSGLKPHRLGSLGSDRLV